MPRTNRISSPDMSDSQFTDFHVRFPWKTRFATFAHSAMFPICAELSDRYEYSCTAKA